MAIKSIIDVQVNDSQFSAFHELFKEYETALANMPENWKEIGGAINSTANDFEKISGGTITSLKIAAMQSAVLSNGLKDAIKALKEVHGNTVRSGTAMDKLVASSAKLGHNIFGISKFLLKTAALESGIFGGALFGLNKLAASAMGTQRDARGLGVSAGQLQSFKLNYERFIDPEAVLGKITHAQGDYSEQWKLAAATGLNIPQATTGNPQQLAMTAAMRAHDWWVNTPATGRTVQNMVPTGLSTLFSLEEVRRLGNTPRETLLAAQKSTTSDQRSLGFSDRTADEWARLNIQLHRAGLMIESVLINKLSPLAPILSRFSAAFASGLATFITAVASKENIKAFSEAMSSLSTYLTNGDFKKNLQQLGEVIGDLANIIKATASLLGLSTEPDTTAPAAKKVISKGWYGSITRNDSLDKSIARDWEKSNADAAAVAQHAKHGGHELHHSVNRLVNSLAKQKPPVTVTVNNNSSANVATSINALSH